MIVRLYTSIFKWLCTSVFRYLCIRLSILCKYNKTCLHWICNYLWAAILLNEVDSAGKSINKICFERLSFQKDLENKDSSLNKTDKSKFISFSNFSKTTDQSFLYFYYSIKISKIHTVFIEQIKCSCFTIQITVLVYLFLLFFLF